MKSISSFLVGPAAFALVALSWPSSPQNCDGSLALPESSHLVWRVANKNGGSASACPVKTLKDGTTLFLTSRHVTRDMGPAGASRAIVESRDKLRKLIIVSHTPCPKADLALLVVKGDGNPIKLFELDLLGCKPGDRVYTSGFPGPFTLWFGYGGYMGVNGWHSANVTQGMSGGALLDSAGSLSGVLQGFTASRQLLSVHNEGKRIGGTQMSVHFHYQGHSAMLHLRKEWLRKVKVIE